MPSQQSTNKKAAAAPVGRNVFVKMSITAAMLLLAPLMTFWVIFGVLGAHYASVDVNRWLFFAAAALCSLVCLWGRRVSLWVGVGGVALGVFCAASLAQSTTSACDVARHLSEHRQRLQLVIQDPPRRSKQTQRQVASAVALLRNSGGIPLCGNVELYRSIDAAPLWPGQRVIVSGRLRRAVGHCNPRIADNRRRWCAVHGVTASLHVGTGALVRLGRVQPTPFAQLRLRIRGFFSRIDAPRARGIVEALVLGDRAAVDDATRDAYARAGISHLLAVSGLHLALVALAIFRLFCFLLRRIPFLACRIDVGRPAAAVAGAAAIAYTVLTGAFPATVRACVMVLTFFLCRIALRPLDWLRPLCVSACLIVIWDPGSLMQAGFQLSFAAVFGIALVLRHPWVTRWRSAPLIVSRVASLFLVSLGASLLTLPLCACHFGMISTVGLAVNMLAVPWTSFVLLPVSLCSGLFGAFGVNVDSIAAKTLLAVAEWSAQLLNRLADIVASWDTAAIAVSLSAIATCALVSAIIALLAQNRVCRRTAVVIASIATVISLVQACVPSRHLQMTFLDVGQGDSAFIRFPDGATMLVDAGGSGDMRYDPGERVVVPFLRAHGVTRLDYVVATHLDADHVGGLLAVLDQISVGELWLCWPGGDNDWLSRLTEHARRSGTPIVTPKTITRGDVGVEPLWPRQEGGVCGVRGASNNDNSIVLRIRWNKAVVVLTGDIEEQVEQELRFQECSKLANATVLKVAHHGSDTSSTQEWVHLLSPRFAVVSCGENNRFGFPRPQVIARYEAEHSHILRTDILGAISMEIAPNGDVSWHSCMSDTAHE